MRYTHALAPFLRAVGPRVGSLAFLFPASLAAGLVLGASACLDPAPRDADNHTDVSDLSCATGIIEVAHDIAARYPTWGDAHHDVIDSVDNVWYHPAHQKKELEGVGVTLVAMHYVDAGVKVPGTEDAHWTGDLNEPTLLFFEKVDALNADDWPLIGFGYHVGWSDDEGMGGCVRPVADCTTSDELVKSFLVHEAGYHIDGFDPVDDDDLKSGRGVVDANYCNVIDKDDVQDPDLICIGCDAEGVGAKHGRAWTMHVWIHPTFKYPLITGDDPWARDNGNGWEYPVEARSFGAQGNCGCNSAAMPPPSPVMGMDADTRIVRESFLDQLAQEVQEPVSPIGMRVTDVMSGDEVIGYRIVEMSWFYEADDLGFLSGDVVQEIAGIRIQSWDDFVAATQRLAELPPGSPFAVRMVRDQEQRLLPYRVGQG